jgi:hypothetical protein
MKEIIECNSGLIEDNTETIGAYVQKNKIVEDLKEEEGREENFGLSQQDLQRIAMWKEELGLEE